MGCGQAANYCSLSSRGAPGLQTASSAPVSSTSSDMAVSSTSSDNSFGARLNTHLTTRHCNAAISSSEADSVEEQQLRMERERAARGLHVPGEPLNPQRPRQPTTKRKPQKAAAAVGGGSAGVAAAAAAAAPGPSDVGAAGNLDEGAPSSLDEAAASASLASGDVSDEAGEFWPDDADLGPDDLAGRGGSWLGLSELAAANTHLPGTKPELIATGTLGKGSVDDLSAAAVKVAKGHLDRAAESSRVPVGFKVKAGSKLRPERLPAELSTQLEPADEPAEAAATEGAAQAQPAAQPGVQAAFLTPEQSRALGEDLGED